MSPNSVHSPLGRLAGVLLLAAGCAAPDAGAGGSFWSRLNPRSRNTQVAGTPRARDLKNPASLHLHYGRWREQVGDTDDARVSYESVLRDDPKNVDALVGLARLDALAGRTDDAERRLAKALRDAPGQPRVLAAQGQLFAHLNRWPEAVDALNAAVLAAPQTPDYRYQLAVALARSGDIDTALPHFAKTVGVAEAHYNVGYILHEQGRAREAERHLAEALRQRPDLHVAQTVLDELRGGRTRLTAPPVVAETPRPQSGWAAPQAPPAQTALASERAVLSHATATPAAAAGRAAVSTRFAGTPNPPVEHAASSVPQSSSWYPTPHGRPPDDGGLTAAQREQMLNQRMVDGSAFHDGTVRR
ncbi:MAG TPA: tetratricopeptide repeat protein [Planctomycetaceae bacterium]|nr:tetratricopeptide repeat protein [Planctomycetaceae bacterium]